MTDVPSNLREVEDQLYRIRSDTLLEIKGTNLGLEYARDRYFEVENRILKERINRLEQPASICDTLLYVALGGITGAFVEAVVTRALTKLLANHLVYVNTFIDIAPRDRERVRDFLRIPTGTPKRIVVREFLNENSVWGRLYRFVPQFIGSRFDEVLQDPRFQTAFWPKASSVAELLLQSSAWSVAQEMTTIQEFDQLHQDLRSGHVDTVRRRLDERESLVHGFGSEKELIAAQLADVGRTQGEYFLIALFAQSYGPARRLADVRRASVPTKKKKSGGYEARLIEKIGDREKVILQVLIEELIHPVAKPPRTYQQVAFDDVPDDLRQFWKERPTAEKEGILDRAGVELLGHMDAILQQMRRSAVPINLLTLGVP